MSNLGSHWLNLDCRPPMVYGFVYKITNKLNNKIYIGKKSFGHGAAWETYIGSSKELKSDIKEFGKLNFVFELMQLADNEKHLAYLEMKIMMEYNVLEREDSYNKNVQGFIKGKLLRK